MEKDVSLKDKNSFHIGGIAKHYALVSSKEELIEAIAFAKESKLPVFIMGEGSNILVSDDGFKGVVIKLNFKQITDSSVGAGVPLRDLILETKTLNLGGLEWAVGIPGTVGGAIFGNAGAFKHSISEVIEEVEFFDGKEIKIFQNSECSFNYRESIFKNNPNLIILGAKFRFKGGFDDELNRDCLNKRSVPKGYSIGSIFKNPEGYFAGRLIEECGLKGKKIGEAIISKEHANWIINLGNASSKDVEALISLMKTEVKKKFNIDLVEEIRRL
ncbi:MAG: UDP-N-acetylmuramate dehydrogenase [Candidatus Pacebacteria bacterium]|nr:UDP-N-acetylmuramate dehydrogenase [Candidatus Paceibacterota bacterium]MDD3919120.1 UDP-N-acetylmuramate dehydrogenase [Candidatus Paceibacterota bacterium]